MLFFKLADLALIPIYKLLGCSGFGRVDTIVEDDTPLVLDVKTIPGFTETSTFPLAAEAAGISFDSPEPYRIRPASTLALSYVLSVIRFG